MEMKKANIFRQMINSVLLSGIIMLFIGAFYCVVKAGIPYQDPTLEMQIEYAVNMRIGEILLGKGLVIAVCGGIVRLLFGLLLKKRQKK